MAAEEHLGPQFYHGTNWEHQPGDRLLPGNEHDSRRGDVASVLWTTTRPHYAAKWGDNVYEVKHEGLVQPVKRGHDVTPYNSLGATVVRKVPGEEIRESRMNTGHLAEQDMAAHQEKANGG